MPLHDVGYRKWDGCRTSNLTRTLAIAGTGIRLASKTAWVKRMILFAWLPGIWWGVAFFAYERAVEIRGLANNNQNLPTEVLQSQRNQMRGIAERFRIPQANRLVDKLERGDTSGSRNIFWSWFNYSS